MLLRDEDAAGSRPTDHGPDCVASTVPVTPTLPETRRFPPGSRGKLLTWLTTVPCSCTRIRPLASTLTSWTGAEPGARGGSAAETADALRATSVPATHAFKRLAITDLQA